MSTCCDDSVFDFDLNFLRSTPSPTTESCSSEKQRDSILFIKKRILTTDSLIRKYFNKNDALELCEKNLLSAKEECKQICIDYKQSVDTCTALEKNLQELRDVNKELESKYSNLENQFQALGSHSSQLQTLVKEYETRIEALKIENILGKPSDKDCKKMLQPLQKENSLLIKHLCLARDIIFGKRKYRLLHKNILKKYDKYKSPDKDPLFEEDENTVDYICDEIPWTPIPEYDDDAEPSKENKSQTTKNPNNADLSRITNNSTVESNDIASIDTGRGSSFALTVSEKSFQSTEYFINDSPLSDDNELTKVKTKLVNSSTSPIPFYAVVNVSTSPIIFKDNVQKNDNAIDRALSPIVLIADVDDDIRHVNDDVSVSSEINYTSENCKINEETRESEKQQKEIECLELNNSENICKENSNDCEIEMIFNTMRLHNTLITPIPPTPAKSCSTNRYSTPNKQNQPVSVVCSEALLAREENKQLQTTVAELAKELDNIKKILISRSILMQNNEECTSYNQLCDEVITNKDQIMTVIPSPPTQLPSLEQVDILCTTEKSRSNSRRNSLNVSMDIANLQVIPEVEENLQDTSELQYEDAPPSINDTEKLVVNLSEINVQNLESPVSIISSDDQSRIKEVNVNKRLLMKRKKITNLEKLKRKCLPKYKIRRENLTLKEKGFKPKRIPISAKKKTVTETDSSATLNDKKVYEKAVKVMSELKQLKRISTDSIKVQQIDDNVSEVNRCNDIINTEFRKDKKQEDSNFIVLSPSGMDNQSSDPVQTPLSSPDSHSNDISALTLDEDENDNEEHVVVFKVLSTLPDDYNCLKRRPESISPEIPCKRMLSDSIPDMELRDTEVMLQRRETSTYDYRPTPENFRDTSKNISITPKCKNSSLKVITPSSLFSPEVISKTLVPLESMETQNTYRRRRKSVKDKNPQQSIPEANERLEKNYGQTLFSNRKKSVVDLFSADGFPKVPNGQESHGNKDLIVNEEKSLKDTYSPDFSPGSLDSLEIVDTQNITNNRRKSVQNTSFQHVFPTATNNLDLEVNLKGSELLYKNTNQKLSSSPGKSVKAMSSQKVSSVALESKKSNSNEHIQAIARNRRTNEKDIMSSPKAGPEVSESQKVNSIECMQNMRNPRKSIINSLEVSPKVQESQIKNSSQDLSNNQRKSVKDVPSADSSTETSENQNNITIQETFSNRRKSVKDVSSPEVGRKASVNHKIINKQDIQELPTNRRKSDRDISTMEASPKASETQKRYENQSVQDIISHRRKSVRGKSSPEFCFKALENQETNDKQSNQNIIVTRRKSVRDPSSLASSPKAVEDQKSNKNHAIHDNTSNRRKSHRDISFPECNPTASEGHGNGIQAVEDITSNRRKILVITSPEGDPMSSEGQNGNGNQYVEDYTSNKKQSLRDISFTEGELATSVGEKGNENKCVGDITKNRRKSLRDVSSTKEDPTDPTLPKGQNRNGNQCVEDISNNRRKSFKDIFSTGDLTALDGQKRNSNQCVENITSNRRKSIKGVSSPEFSPKAPENEETNQSIQNATNRRRQSIKEISYTETGSKKPENQEQVDNWSNATNWRRDVKDSDFGNNEQSVSNKRRKIESGGPEHVDITECQSVRENILCRMIEQHGVKSVKFTVKKIPDSIINSTAKKIEDGIIIISELPSTQAKDAMNKFVVDIRNWEVSNFVAGLIKYLKDPTRKIELFSKIVVPSAPALTKSEQILLYVIAELKKFWCSVDIIDKILSYIEYTLFSLNRTPQFEVIESMSHFYAVVCRYFKMKTRLRIFVLDAMYCIQFKAIPLIKQCFEVWMHILPLAHMPSGQTPLVTCLVYLLHFYKCQDKMNRVQEIRNILSRKYFYKITEWNETRILELCRNSIVALKGIPSETKMLRLALIILAKRQGPRWCHNNIVKNVLQPIIEKQNNPEHIKAFCVSMFGPLLKPFPADMKVHCEVVMNQLITMLQDNPTTIMAEAAVTSLLYINKHNQFKVIQALVAWKQKIVSPELELMLKDFVKSKPLKVWKTTLAKAVQ